MSTSTKQKSQLRQPIFDSLVEEGSGVQWAGEAAIEHNFSCEVKIEVDHNEIFNINGRTITAKKFNEEQEYYNNIVEFLPFNDTGLVFNIEQLTQFDYHGSKFDFYRRKLEYQGRNRGCGNNKLYNQRKHNLVDAHCNQYSCEYCRSRLLKNLRINIVKYAEKHDLTRFITITFGGNDLRRLIRPDNSFHYVMKRFNNWREYLKRKFDVNVSYINLIRSHKDGYCHLHILIDRFIPKSWLSKSTSALGLGSTNVKYVDIHRVTAYLSKYFREKDHEWFLPKGIHHYTTSRTISINDYIPDPGWIYIKMPLRLFRDVNGILIRNYVGEIECVYNHVEWYTKYPPPFEFFLAEFIDIVNS